jgi:hypothetical protein
MTSLHAIIGDRDLPADFDVVAAVAPRLTPSRRADGWTPERQRDFLEFLSAGHTVTDAARGVGLTHQSAYRFRQSSAGAAFALGWEAALLLQRQKLADTLTARAFDGQRDTITRADGSTWERHRYDNRLALALLSRLDRLAEAAPESDRHGEAQAARLVAADWEAYLDLVTADRGPAGAGLFLAARARTDGDADAATQALAPLVTLARADLRARTGASDAGEVDASDLDVARRHEWSGDDFRRAEAAGLVVVAPSPAEPAAAAAEPAHNPHLPQHSRVACPEWGDPERDMVWWDELADEWRTCFSPPEGFAGDEDGVFGDDDYTRAATPEETAAMDRLVIWQDERLRHEGASERDGWFARITAAMARMGEGEGAPVLAEPVEAQP